MNWLKTAPDDLNRLESVKPSVNIYTFKMANEGQIDGKKLTQAARTPTPSINELLAIRKANDMSFIRSSFIRIPVYKELDSCDISLNSPACSRPISRATNMDATSPPPPGSSHNPRIAVVGSRSHLQADQDRMHDSQLIDVLDTLLADSGATEPPPPAPSSSPVGSFVIPDSATAAWITGAEVEEKEDDTQGRLSPIRMEFRMPSPAHSEPISDSDSELAEEVSIAELSPPPPNPASSKTMKTRTANKPPIPGGSRRVLSAGTSKKMQMKRSPREKSATQRSGAPISILSVAYSDDLPGIQPPVPEPPSQQQKIEQKAVNKPVQQKLNSPSFTTKTFHLDGSNSCLVEEKKTFSLSERHSSAGNRSRPSSASGSNRASYRNNSRSPSANSRGASPATNQNSRSSSRQESSSTANQRSRSSSRQENCATSNQNSRSSSRQENCATSNQNSRSSSRQENCATSNQNSRSSSRQENCATPNQNSRLSSRQENYATPNQNSRLSSRQADSSPSCPTNQTTMGQSRSKEVKTAANPTQPVTGLPPKRPFKRSNSVPVLRAVATPPPRRQLVPAKVGVKAAVEEEEEGEKQEDENLDTKEKDEQPETKAEKAKDMIDEKSENEETEVVTLMAATTADKMATGSASLPRISSLETNTSITRPVRAKTAPIRQNPSSPVARRAGSECGCKSGVDRGYRPKEDVESARRPASAVQAPKRPPLRKRNTMACIERRDETVVINTRPRTAAVMDEETMEECRHIHETMAKNGVILPLETIKRSESEEEADRGLLQPTDTRVELIEMNQTALPASTSAGLLSHPSKWLPNEYKRVQASRKLVRQATEIMILTQKNKEKAERAKAKKEKSPPVSAVSAATVAASQRPLTAGHAEHYAAFERTSSANGMKPNEKQVQADFPPRDKRPPPRAVLPQPSPTASLSGFRMKHMPRRRSIDPVADTASQFVSQVPEEDTNPVELERHSAPPRNYDEAARLNYWDTASDLMRSAVPHSARVRKEEETKKQKEGETRKTKETEQERVKAILDKCEEETGELSLADDDEAETDLEDVEETVDERVEEAAATSTGEEERSEGDEVDDFFAAESEEEGG